MGDNGKIPKCWLYGQRPIVEQYRRKCGTRGHMNYICRALFMSDWVQFGVIRCTLKFPMLTSDFSKAILPAVFIQYQPSFRERIAIGGTHSICACVPDFKKISRSKPANNLKQDESTSPPPLPSKWFWCLYTERHSLQNRTNLYVVSTCVK